VTLGILEKSNQVMVHSQKVVRFLVGPQKKKEVDRIGTLHLDLDRGEWVTVDVLILILWVDFPFLSAISFLPCQKFVKPFAILTKKMEFNHFPQ